jgi:hypothetical protein|tara:strand:- start:275 stop:709 length:435 start_codon:yes stop_codon:yes gene_type:complete
MTKFERRFFKKLHEQNDEREAFEAELDDNTDPGDFDVDVEVDDTVVDEDPNVKAAQAVNERNEAMKEQLRGWIGRMEDFLDYLNGEEADSIQQQLANAEPDTIFDRMKASEQRKLARVATELAGVTESFKGYLAQTGNPSFKHV